MGKMIKIAEIDATNNTRANELAKIFEDKGYTIAYDEEFDYRLYILKEETK